MNETVVDRLAAKFGGQTPMADAIGTSQSTVAHWKRRGVVPARQQIKIIEAGKRLGIIVRPSDFFAATAPKRRRAA